jgi:hypothetical protein
MHNILYVTGLVIPRHYRKKACTTITCNYTSLAVVCASIIIHNTIENKNPYETIFTPPFTKQPSAKT